MVNRRAFLNDTGVSGRVDDTHARCARCDWTCTDEASPGETAVDVGRRLANALWAHNEKAHRHPNA